MDEPIADVVTAAPAQRFARRDSWRDRGVPDFWHAFIGGQHEQDIAGGSGLRDFDWFESFLYGLLAIFILSISDDDANAAIA